MALTGDGVAEGFDKIWECKFNGSFNDARMRWFLPPICSSVTTSGPGLTSFRGDAVGIKSYFK